MKAFEDYYEKIYLQRWSELKAALLGSKKYVAIFNPYLEIEKKSNDLVDLKFEHELREYFPQPIKISEMLNYYLMDPASAMCVEVLDPRPHDMVLDLCAAPGGKSLLIAFRLMNQGSLISNDISQTRRERLKKIFQGYLPENSSLNHKITAHDAGSWCLYEKNKYDRILLDAPCSSERHLLEDPKKMNEWAVGRTKKLSLNQFTMLVGALDVVKVGGTIVYSTCSISPLENDEVIEKLYVKRPNRLEIEDFSLSVGEKTKYGWMILPDQCGFGPLYICKIKRLG